MPHLAGKRGIFFYLRANFFGIGMEKVAKKIGFIHTIQKDDRKQ
jgi:hypothetical protein